MQEQRCMMECLIAMTDCTHILTCINKKEKGKCCALFNTERVYEFLREEINRKRHLFKDPKKVKAVKTSCLGQCAFGPNIFIIPDNIWYTFSCIEDVIEIVDTHFIQGKRVERLINSRIHNDVCTTDRV